MDALDPAVSPMTIPMPWSMNRPRPMVAPGWISTPVMVRANCEIIRARKKRLCRYSQWVKRW